MQRIGFQTFPMACPPEADSRQLKAYLTENMGKSFFRQIIGDGSRSVLCAARGYRVAGFAVVKHAAELPIEYEAEGATSELEKLYVARSHHGRGTAQRLLLAAFDSAASAGSQQIILGVYNGNTRAKRFYSKFGFVEVGQTEFRMGSEVHLDSVMVASVT